MTRAARASTNCSTVTTADVRTHAPERVAERRLAPARIRPLVARRTSRSSARRACARCGRHLRTQSPAALRSDTKRGGRLPRGAHTREDGWLLAAACARPLSLRSRKPAIAIQRADFRPRVRVAARQHGRFMPRDGCRHESSRSRRGSVRVRAIVGFPAAAPAAAGSHPSSRVILVERGSSQQVGVGTM